MAELNQSRLEEALHLLGEYLAYDRAEPVRLLVVGGSALLASGLISRPTFDLDIMAQRGPLDGEIIDARPLPESLVTAATKVATEMKLSGKWINADFSLLAFSFEDYPSNFLDDLIDREYGRHLSISFLGRTGQIYLKFHAATDLGRKRRSTDLADLQGLRPTSAETRRTLEWMRGHGLITSANRADFETVLRTLGHDAFISAT